jgi:hypothetical protein
MLRFHPDSPTTVEENEENIASLEAQVQVASSMRDYSAADRLQRDLDYCLQVREYLAEQVRAASTVSALQRLEEQERQEEASIRLQFELKMSDVTQLAAARLTEIEAWHDTKLDELDRRFSNPRFGAIRVSPDVKWLMRAESWYANRRDFKWAHGYKQLATLRTQHDMDQIAENADHVVAAAVAAVERRYQQCRASVQMKLEDGKFRLRRAAAVAIGAMKNKYMKLRHNVLISTEIGPPPADEGQTIYSTLEDAYAHFVQTTMEESIATRSPRRYPKTPQKPVFTRGRSPRVARALEKTGTLVMTL